MSEPAAPQQAPPAAKPPRRRGQLIAGGIVALAGLFIIVGLWLAYRPAAGQLQGMVEAEEQAFIEQFVAHPTIETLDITVLHRLSRCDVVPLDLVILGPGEDGIRGEFRAVV